MINIFNKFAARDRIQAGVLAVCSGMI